MNQLRGKHVNLVLAVDNGRGMEFVKHPIHVAGNYNGRILESDKIPVGNCAPFNTELIWEVDKKDLRKLRSSNQPLRVECISTDLQNRRDRIGFVLLSLRSAQIIPKRDYKAVVKSKWYKLIGCQADKKKHQPELYLSLTIRDHEFPQEEPSPKHTPLISEEEPPEDDEFTTSFSLKYLDDGYIQIGDEDQEPEDLESFSLNLLVRVAKNLDTLLPEALVFKQNNEKYHMTFKIFGVAIKTKPFYKNFQDTFALNEKVVVRLLATQQNLEEFFSTQKIKITLYSGHELLGSTEVELGDVTFEEQTAKCFFTLPLPHNVTPFGGDESSPFLEVRKWLKRSTDSRYKLHLAEKEVAPLNLTSASPGFGDQVNSYVLDKLEKVEVKSKSECSLSPSDQENLPFTKSVDSVIRNLPLSPRQSKPGTYLKYVLEIKLYNITWKVAQKEKEVLFKFLHPKESNCITILTQTQSNQVGEKSDLKNIQVKLCYVSALNQIENLLKLWPPKLVLTDEKEKPLSAEYKLDLSNFFNDEHKNSRLVAELKTVKTSQSLAKLEIGLNLEEHDLDDIDETTNLQLTPPIIDEVLTLKELTELETWKKIQKELFQQQLRLLEEQQNQRLETSWKEKRQAMEQKLEEQMKKCKTLQDELQSKVDSLKTEKYLIRRRNHSNIFEEIFRENWEKYCQSDMKDIIQLLSKTQRDNEYLRKLVEDQRNKLQLLEKTSLTKEQTSNLLQELKELEKGFEEAQNAKKYFKEQWKNACDEIHEIKTEEYRNLQVNLKKSREELSHLSLDGLLTDRSATDTVYTFH